MSFQKIKGTLDFFGIEKRKFSIVEKVAKDITSRWGFQEMDTPIFESTDLFKRGVGDDTDIVSKEMYTFLDKGERSLTLRPEGTASITRAIVENKLYANPLPLKVSYFGPMFRYERPQAGRLRQFTQFGVEVFGIESAKLDADLIYMCYVIFQQLGLSKLKIKLNSLGDQQSRMNYQNALKDYFLPKVDTMCQDCKIRVNKNPLRILDCKIDSEKDEIKNAPRMKDFLSEDSLLYLREIEAVLSLLGVPYEVDDNLVRGLDYYTNTVFEIIYDDPNSNINGLALCGGGRYNGLSKDLGGPELKAIGFAFGVERIMMAIDATDGWGDLSFDADIMVIALSEQAKVESMKLANQLRLYGKYVEIDYVNTNLKPQFKLSDRSNASVMLIIGDDELSKGEISIKTKGSNEQTQIKIQQLMKYLNIDGVKEYAYTQK
jgi:histidyl-tRNA synthetase